MVIQLLISIENNLLIFTVVDASVPREVVELPKMESSRIREKRRLEARSKMKLRRQGTWEDAEDKMVTETQWR